MKILVVDDSKIMRRIIVNTLNQLKKDNIINFDDTVQAEDGLEAWQALQENPDIGVIITDWNMPNMNGLELVKKIRADERFKKIPIIMVTTEGGKKEVITALKAGVNNYIVKPFDKKTLKEKLEVILGKK